MAAAFCPLCKTSANMTQCPRCQSAMVIDEIYPIEDGGAFPSSYKPNSMNELGAIDFKSVEKAIDEFLLTIKEKRK
jgi:hypothetical protein